MDDHSKTIMCSVLFLDIVEYSRTPVYGQIALKHGLDTCLATALWDVPADDRITLDTGDGAAVSFLGDVGDALRVALRVRDSIAEYMHMQPPLVVRMGINVGPARLVRDLNGQQNIVGDSINVAQRVMGFADPGQILVSRPYHDAVSRLSVAYAGMFQYIGARTDKHVREHEVYAIGAPGESTCELTAQVVAEPDDGEDTLSANLGLSWRAAAVAFRKASPAMRAVYVMVITAPLGALVGLPIALALALTQPAPPPWRPAAPLAPAIVAAVPPSPSIAVAGPIPSYVAIPVPVAAAAARKKRHLVQPSDPDPRAKITVACQFGTTIFVDGRHTGTIAQQPVVIHVDAGRHTVVLVRPTKSQVHAEDVTLAAGRSLHLASNDFCS